jgi:hypothetical protein
MANANGPMSWAFPCCLGLDPDSPAGDGAFAAAAIADPDATPNANVPPVADAALVADASAEPIPLADADPVATPTPITTPFAMPTLITAPFAMPALFTAPIAMPAPVTTPGPTAAPPVRRLIPTTAEAVASANVDAMTIANVVTMGTTAIADVEGTAFALVPLF